MNYCSNCINWIAKPGLKPERQGHCAMFNRTTDAISGELCSAFTDRAAWQERHGQAVENSMLARFPDVI